MSAFEDFIQVELPRRPWVDTDPAQESIPVRRGPGPRQLDFVSLTDGQVLGQVAGVVQGVDISGIGIKSHVHTQTVLLEAWYIIHNQNSTDFIIYLEDASGDTIIPNNVSAVDPNIIEVDFGTAITGKAVLLFAT
jgi:sorbitol-specific phosphotransferase system component IIBC